MIEQLFRNDSTTFQGFYTNDETSYKKCKNRSKIQFIRRDIIRQLPRLELPLLKEYKPHDQQDDYDKILDELYFLFSNEILKQNIFSLNIDGYKMIEFPMVDSMDDTFFSDIETIEEFSKEHSLGSGSFAYYHINNLVFDLMRYVFHYIRIDFWIYIHINHIEIPIDAYINYDYFRYIDLILDSGLYQSMTDSYIKKKRVIQLYRKIFQKK